MSEKQVRKKNKRCYYSDYVNHAIRFYLSTPEGLKVEGKKKADVSNWMAVQSVFYSLPDDDRELLTAVYSRHYRLSEAVRLYCLENKIDEKAEGDLWTLIAKTGAVIARRRGLI